MTTFCLFDKTQASFFLDGDRALASHFLMNQVVLHFISFKELFLDEGRSIDMNIARIFAEVCELAAHSTVNSNVSVKSIDELFVFIA